MKRDLTIGAIVLVAALSRVCSFANIEPVKAAAPRVWREQGFEVVAYEGWQVGLHLYGPYGGACVWHRLRKVPDNGITYSGYIKKWGDEFHVYGPDALDAIRPQK